MITEFMVLLACWKLPDILPEEYRKSNFYMKKGTLHTILIFIGILMLGTSYVNLSDLKESPMAAVACIVYVVVLFLYTQVRYKHVLSRRRALP